MERLLQKRERSFQEREERGERRAFERVPRERSFREREVPSKDAHTMYT